MSRRIPLHKRLRAVAKYKISQSGHDTIKSIQCTLKKKKDKNSRKFTIVVCFPTHSCPSLVSFRKLSTGPLKSLSDKVLCAKCVLGGDQIGENKRNLTIKMILTTGGGGGGGDGCDDDTDTATLPPHTHAHTSLHTHARAHTHKTVSN